MVLNYFLCLISLLLIGISTKKLSVTSVETGNSYKDSLYLYGSTLGGTVLYIKGTGFKKNPSLNSVSVGNYPCIIPQEGQKEESLYCVTSSIFPLKFLSQNLKIVITSGKQTVTANQVFQYAQWQTPQLMVIYPSHSYPGQKIRFIGKHKISMLGNESSPGQIVGLYTGEQICTRIGIKQQNISSWSVQPIQCLQSKTQQGGRYSVKQHLQVGIASKSTAVKKTSLNAQKYEYVVFPTITTVTPKSGPIGGSRVTIKGSGFPTKNRLVDRKKVQVTVDNTQCLVFKTSSNQIRCNLRKKSVNSSKIPNSKNSTSFTYDSGAGFIYKRFNSKTNISVFQAMQNLSPNLSNIQVIQTFSKGELQSICIDCQDSVQTLQGYFLAPNSGNYTFTADYTRQFKSFINSDPGVPSVNKSLHSLLIGDYKPVVLGNSSINNSSIAGTGGNHSNSSFMLAGNNFTKTIALQGGKYYFMKIYIKAHLHGDYFKMMVQVPNTNKSLGWKAPQIHTFKTNFTNKERILRFRGMGASSGNIRFTVLVSDPNTLMVSFNKSVQIAFNATAETFCSMVNQFHTAENLTFNLYMSPPRCQRKLLDASLNQITDVTSGTQVWGYQWTLYYVFPVQIKTCYWCWPQFNHTLTNQQQFTSVTYVNAGAISGTAPQVTQQVIQSNGQAINGTFRIISQNKYINYTQQSVEIPFNIDQSYLQWILRKHFGNDNIFVSTKDDYEYYMPNWNFYVGYGRTWTIQIQHPQEQFPSLSFEDENLLGGLEGTKPTILYKIVKPYTDNLLFNPVSYELMRTFSAKPSIVVKVNNVQSLCINGACQFTFLTQSTQISRLQMNSTAAVFNLTKQVLNSQSNVQIQIDQNPACKTVQFPTNSSIICVFATNADGNPIFRAGSYFPQVMLDGTAVLQYLSTVNKIQFAFQVKNPQPNNGSNIKSTLVTLQGKGLPTNTTDLELKVCGKVAQIQSITAERIKFFTPQIQNSSFTVQAMDCPINVTYGEFSPTQTFYAGNFQFIRQMNMPQINGISPQLSNPSRKGSLWIYGNLFDPQNSTNISNVNVTLKSLDGSKVYIAKVFKYNNSAIQIGLSGGIAGTYIVNVEIKGKGHSIPHMPTSNIFQYRNTIQSLYPSIGSAFGGKKIQITGTNFLEDKLENQISIGQRVCTILSATKQKLVCITPPKDLRATSSSFQASVMSKQISKSECVGNCTFVYESVEKSPRILSISPNLIGDANTIIIISGLNLTNQIGQQTSTVILWNIKMNKKYTIVPLMKGQNTIIFKSIPLVLGEYEVFVDVEGVGYSNSTYINASCSVNAVTQAVSTAGGIVTITGFGFPSTFDNQPFQVELRDSLETQILLENTVLFSSQTKIQLRVPPRVQNSQYIIKMLVNGGLIQYFVKYQSMNTPKANLISNSTVQWKNTENIMLSVSHSPYFSPDQVHVYSTLNLEENIPVTWGHDTVDLIRINNTLPPGNYKFRILNRQNGYFEVQQSLSVIIPNLKDKFTFTSSNLSMQGGYITFVHQNDLINKLGQNVKLMVNNLPAEITKIDDLQSKLRYPVFVQSNEDLQQQALLAQASQNDKKQFLESITRSKRYRIQRINVKDLTSWSQSGNKLLTKAVYDGLAKTTYKSNSEQCQLGLFFGNNYEIQISTISFYPDRNWRKPEDFLKDAKFQGSTDNITWTTIKTLNYKLRRGWNNIQIVRKDRKPFRYFRFLHNNLSNCKMAQIALRGARISNRLDPVLVLGKNSVKLSYSDGLNTFTWPNIFFYTESQTPVVEKVIPSIGKVQGGQHIMLIGKGFSLGTPEISVDGKLCVVNSVNQSVINCTTSPRLQTPVQITFEVNIGQRSALLKESFKYVYRWSDITTWGVDLPPVEDDLIYIPPNMHLYVDESTPKLVGIIAENSTIQISDQSDISVHTANIILMGAKLIAGTPEKPYTHQLTFTFYGKQQENQIPFFGNKGIGCTDCQISLHGAPKLAWTRVNKAEQNSQSVTIFQKSIESWKVNDQIVVSSSSFEYLQSQKLVITGIQNQNAAQNTTLTTKQTLEYSHSSTFEDIQNNSKVFVGSQVASLSRNIRLQGDSTSDETQYGIHFTFIGSQYSGLEVKISNIQLRNCGQPRKQRHCINFNRNQDMMGSYVINSTASQTYAKFFSIASTNYLNISSNVGYKVKGHNIQLKDGTEQENIIENNLMISSLPYFRDLQSDVMVASYYISHPNNFIRNNVAAGSYYYGFLYDFKAIKEDGIFANELICTSGSKMAQNKGNVVHSNRVFGVRIKQLYARNSPCLPSKNDSLENPWSQNPSLLSVFQDYVIYRNKDLGLMCDQIGHVTFNNFTMVQNFNAHMQFHEMNYTRENVVVSNSTFIGAIDTTTAAASILTGASLVLPRSGSINLTDILFSKVTQKQLVIQTCSLCDDPEYYTNTGQQYFMHKIQYRNVSGRYLEMLGLQRQIIYDQDGTFSRGVFDNVTRTRATIVKGYRHILAEPGCLSSQNQAKWDQAAICGSNLTIRRVTLLNIKPMSYIQFYPPRVSRLTSPQADSSVFEQIPAMLYGVGPLKEIVNSWSAPFVAGSAYKFATTFELEFFDVMTTRYYQTTDRAIIFKFSYVISRELFDIVKIRNDVSSSIIPASTALLNRNTCNNGDSFHNDTSRQMHLCMSGKNTTLFESLRVAAIYCRNKCPLPPVIVDPPTPNPGNNTSNNTNPSPPPIDLNICIRQTFVRKWSNITQWPSNRLPKAGQNVTVHCNWTMELDVDPPAMAQLIIDGNLTVLQNRQLINITAQSIWVRLGALKFGNLTDSFDKKVVIQLNGRSNDRGFIIDANYGGRKNLVVSGRLEIYGPDQYDQETYLTKQAQAGQTSIQVASAIGWDIGDQIIVSTSSEVWTQSERFKILKINDEHTITLSSPLKHFHYGSPNPSINTTIGHLNTASKVIYVSRNIKIVSGPAFDFGFAVLVYGFVDQNSVTHMGSVFLRGVEFNNGGQSTGRDAVLGFTNTVLSTHVSLVTKSSFVTCNSQCITIQNARKLYISNNVFFNARRAHIKAIKLRQSSIFQNVMIQSRKQAGSLQNLAVCLQNRDMVNSPLVDNLTIFNNQCYGSQDIGFILPYLACGIEWRPITGNVAGGCSVGFYMVKLAKQTSRCLVFQENKAFNCHYGVVGNPDQTTNLTYRKMILMGNKQGVILRFSSKQKDNTAYLIDSYISAIANTNCLSCYQKPESCSQFVGVRLLSVTQNPNRNRVGYNATLIGSSSPLDAKTFIQNVQFVNFRMNHSAFNEQISKCGNNFIFKAHQQAVDLVGSTYIYSSNMLNCDAQSVAYFRPFDEKHLGLQGGCGESSCTSLENYFIQDFSSNFLGEINAKALPNNIYLSNKTKGCRFVQAMNGYICNATEEISVLQFESIARDFNSRIVWPVNLISHSDDSVNITLNVEKQWSFRNGYPEGKRKARFNSLFKLNNTYNLTFYNRAPSDLIFQIQQKSPEAERFGWIKMILQYPDQNSIRLNANGQEIDPIVLLDNRTESDPIKQVCGSYKYVYDRKYIEYVLTTDCRIRMSFVNSVKASVRMNQAVADFFTSNGTGKFIDKMSKILGITDISRIKIVGVYTGSTIVDFYVEQLQTTTLDNATEASSSSQTVASVQQISVVLNQAVDSGSLQAQFTAAGLGNVMSVSSAVVILSQTGTFQTDLSNIPEKKEQQSLLSFDNANTMTVVIAAVVTSIAVIIMVGAVLYFKCLKKPNTVLDQSVGSVQCVQQIKHIDKENIVDLDIKQSKQVKYFDDRIQKATNLEKLKKNSNKVKTTKNVQANGSFVNMNNPFDQYYVEDIMPAQSNQKLGLNQ